MRDFTEGMTFDDYLRDDKTRFAVERCVAIVSEAARRLPKEVAENHPAIPWEDVKGIGNILRHNYDRIDDRIVWTVLTRHLPPLEAAIDLIAAEFGLELPDQSRR